MEKLELIKNDVKKNDKEKNTATLKSNSTTASQSSPKANSCGINLEEDDVLIILIAFLLIQDKKIDPILVIVLAILLLDIDITQILK